MSAANIDRATILRDVRVVTTANIASHPNLASKFALAHNVLSKLAGREIYVVTWPNGVAAMVDADPGTAGWNDLLVTTYIACLQNHVGPVGG
jgi:hypothetical protein